MLMTLGALKFEVWPFNPTETGSACRNEEAIAFGFYCP
jgi:hypothetical protein